jgi:hypothetical protein
MAGKRNVTVRFFSQGGFGEGAGELAQSYHAGVILNKNWCARRGSNPNLTLRQSSGKTYFTSVK